jgi:sirohydrochlorin ferrochelatase
MSLSPSSAWFLFDNGSFRAESTISLRRAAAALGGHTGLPVQAVSLLHSTNVSAEALGGERARLLEPALTAHFMQFPEGEAVLIPLFFGPSAALTDYVPARLAALRLRFPKARVSMAPWLVNPDEADARIAVILADQVRVTMKSRGWAKPKVVLVDHGSPQAAVAVVRNHLGEQLRAVLAGEIEELAVASMERREGEAYAFNEPLLATVLRTPPFDRGEICEAAEHGQAELRTQMTETIATDPRLIELLAERLGQARPI